MQDRYAFDVGDYGKIGLLRSLASAHLSLGVLWWRTELGSLGADAKHVSYLSDKRFRACDPGLWDEMGRLFRLGRQRSIAALQPLFPAGTVFHEELVARGAVRGRWFEHSMERVKSCAIVFCDPDNGIVFDETCVSQRHIGLHEIRRLFNAGHSLVIYHHLNRSASHPIQIEQGLDRLFAALPTLTTAWFARYRRGSSRVFFILAQPGMTTEVNDAMERLRSSAWTRRGDFEVGYRILAPVVDSPSAPSVSSASSAALG